MRLRGLDPKGARGDDIGRRSGLVGDWDDRRKIAYARDWHLT